MTMTDLYVFGSIAVVLALMYYFGRKGLQSAHAQRQKRCSTLGWHYDSAPNDNRLYEIRGDKDGVAWVLDSQPDFGPNKEPIQRRPTTTWVARHNSAPEYSMVIASASFARYLASPDAAIPSKMAAIFVTGLGHPLPSSHGAEQSYKTVAVGDATFKQKFGVLAREAAVAEKFVNGALQAVMNRWALTPGREYPSHRCLQVAISTNEVRVTFFDELRDMEHIECLATIGESVLHRVKQASSRV